MKPFDYWKKNKSRSDLRKVTREFEKNFKIKSKCKIEPGKVYALTYLTDGSIPTDKYHVTPIIISMGNFLDENGVECTRGINLLFLNAKECIDIFEDFYRFSDKPIQKRAINTVQLHDKYNKIFPWVFKNFNSTRIRTAVEIKPEEWGLIPCLHKYLFGNFNLSALNEDFQKEIKIRKKFKPVTKEKEKKKEETLEEETVEEDLVTTDLTSSSNISYEQDYE